MTSSRLILRSLSYYWRTNTAVVFGLATAVAVLAGALVVGESVRGSLRDLVLQRLGRTDHAVVSSGFFRENFVDDLRADQTFRESFDAACALVQVQGVVSSEPADLRVQRVQVYGVDQGFWQFHGITPAGPLSAEGREAILSPALAAEVGAAAGSTVLLRVERPSAIPLESLHGRKDDAGRTLRLTVRAIAGRQALGEFSLRPQQGDVRAIFVPLKRLQRDLDLAGRVNTILVADHAGTPAAPGVLEDRVRRLATLEDVGLKLRVLDARRSLALESDSGLLDRPRSLAAGRAAAGIASSPGPVFTYLANSLRSGDREVPYSLVTAIDLRAIAPGSAPDAAAVPPPMILNEWAARDLGAHAGDSLTLEYYVWEEPGRLLTRSQDFRVAGVVPITGPAADSDLVPPYPGISEAGTLADWDPPFPIDLRRVRPIDEEYWKKYRTTPKAFIPIEVGQRLWSSRFGDSTSLRIVPDASSSLNEARDRYALALRAAIDPLALGLSIHPVRAEGLAGSRGATDFGEYFTYFSFFIVASALLLATLFFRLSVEQRTREVGLLRAVGFSTPVVRRLLIGEALLLGLVGSVLGIGGAVGYAALMVTGLRTWWSGAVGTTALTVHTSWTSLAIGAAGALVVAIVCIWWTLRSLAQLSERSLLAGILIDDNQTPQRTAAIGPVVRSRVLLAALAFGTLGAALLAATAVRFVDRTFGFFGVGTSLLALFLCLLSHRLQRPSQQMLSGRGWWPLTRLGLRNASDRPGRSVLAIGVIASASFILISVDAFRREGLPSTDRHSGVGGYSTIVELLLPLANDPNGGDGLEQLGLSAIGDLHIDAFRLQPGDDASCLNLYVPENPRILGVRQDFIEAGRFVFQASSAKDEAERANPWLMLNRSLETDVIPVIADANSMTYVLHKQIGDDLVIKPGGQPVRLRLVGALSDSILQGELLMSETNFLKLFPDREGYQFLLVESPSRPASEVVNAIKRRGAEIGADAVSATDRLAAFHRVENTYLSTFQTLGGLGLLIGTVGLAAVLLRNVLERRRELALLGAVGYRREHVLTIIAAENGYLLGWGLAAGTLSALVAIGPAIVERGGRIPITAAGALLLIAMLVVAALSTVAATRAATRAPLLESLRAE
jgi:ABC-type lipoprotein release transport system permease subunit